MKARDLLELQFHGRGANKYYFEAEDLFHFNPPCFLWTAMHLQLSKKSEIPTTSHSLCTNSHLSATPSLCQYIFPATQWTRLGKWPSSDANTAKSCFRQNLECPTKFSPGCTNAGLRQRRRQEGSAVRNLGTLQSYGSVTTSGYSSTFYAPCLFSK